MGGTLSADISLPCTNQIREECKCATCSSFHLEHSMTSIKGHEIFRLSPWFGFIECVTTIFLHTHHSLLATLGRWEWLMRFNDLKEKPEDTRYIIKITSKQDTKHRECGQTTGFPILPLLGTADSRKVQVRHAWKHLTVDEIPARWRLQLGI